MRYFRVALLAILTVHAVLLAWSATRNSPTFHEVPHLPAGLSHLLLGRFELYRVNPPLPRTVAAFPLLFFEPAPVTDWSNYHTYPTIRSEFRVGADFLKANGDNCLWLYAVARWACIPFSLVGALVCFRWAGLLYGPVSGLWAACCAGGCFPTGIADPSCPTSGVRCELFLCTAGPTNFKACVQTTKQSSTCGQGQPINITCTSCTNWLGSCANLDPNCADLPFCRSAGGTTGWTFEITSSCT